MLEKSNNYVILDSIPTKRHKDKILYDWKNSVGCVIQFKYFDIEGSFEIIQHNGNRDIVVKYKDNTYKIAASSIVSCSLANIVLNSNFKFSDFRDGDLWIELCNIPTTINAGRPCFDWKNSVGTELRFSYLNISGVVKITKYIDKNSIFISYNNSEYPIASSSLIRCMLGGIVLDTKEKLSDFNERGIFVKLSSLPVKSNAGRLCFDWHNSINIPIHFDYRGITGSIFIKKYIKKSQKIDIEYNKSITRIGTGELLDGKIGSIITPINNSSYYIQVDNKEIDLTNLPKKIHNAKPCVDWKNSVGCKVPFKFDDLVGEIEIVKYIGNNKLIVKYCDIEYPALFSTLLNCEFQYIVSPSSPLVETHSNLLHYFKNIEDAYLYSRGCYKDVELICPECGEVRTMKICNFVRGGFSCKSCGDGFSYPEKFCFSVFKQLGINFDTQVSKKKYFWIKGKNRYDIVFEYNGYTYFCEIHGSQHYQDAWVSLEEQQKIDLQKKQDVLENGYKYIEIDFRQSTKEYGELAFLNNEISDIFNFDNIDFNIAHYYAISSRVKDVCKMYNDNISITNIAKHFKISNTTVRRYLKNGSKIGMCKYSPDSKKSYIVYRNNEYIGIFKGYSSIVSFAKNKYNVDLDFRNLSAVANNTRQHTKGFYIDIFEEEAS